MEGRIIYFLITTLFCRTEYVFNFDDTFELHQDVDILKRMGLDCGLSAGKCTGEALREAKAMLPKCFEPIIEGTGSYRVIGITTCFVGKLLTEIIEEMPMHCTYMYIYMYSTYMYTVHVHCNIEESIGITVHDMTCHVVHSLFGCGLMSYCVNQAMISYSS